jgi:hypothetical protein
MSGVSFPLLKRAYCGAEECLRFATCPDALSPSVRLLAEVANEEVRLYSAPERMKCYELELPAKFQRPAQPRSRRAARALYGKEFKESQCIHLCTSSGTTAWWQCGRPNGHGIYALWCPQHAVSAGGKS